MESIDPEVVLRMITKISVAYIRRNDVPRNELPELIAEIRQALTAGADIDAVRDTARPTPSVTRDQSANSATERVRAPAVPIEESVTDDYIINLEDGQRFRSLRRHLMARYGMTPDQYRAKWNLPPDYPMVAGSYARERSEVAKRIGLGQRRNPSTGKRRPGD